MITIQSIRRLTEDFVKDEVPPFPCPTCGDPLIARDNGFHFDQTAESEFYSDNDGDPTMRFGFFTLRLVCSRSGCRESVNCVGSFKVIQSEGRFGEPIYPALLSPKFFAPTVHLFTLSHKLPDGIKKPLEDSFSIFWANPNAAGNSLRISVEALMDYRRVKKRYRDAKDGKMKEHSLHRRIEFFSKTVPHHGSKLLAVKWLGNSGSHPKGLKRKDVIDGYLLYSHVLDELFEKRSATLTKMAKKINRRKGPA